MSKVSQSDTDERKDRIKRPPNAFILYCKDMRTEVLASEPEHTSASLSRRLAELWKNADESKKVYYQRKAAQMQSSFKKKHPEYRYLKHKARDSEKIKPMNEKSMGLCLDSLNKEEIQYLINIGAEHVMEETNSRVCNSDVIHLHMSFNNDRKYNDGDVLIENARSPPTILPGVNEIIDDGDNPHFQFSISNILIDNQ